MKALTHSAPVNPKKQGWYRSVDEAIQQKQAALLKVLAGVDMTRFTSSTGSSNPGNGQGQPASDNVSDVPYEEVK